jgi:hypothetical protein
MTNFIYKYGILSTAAAVWAMALTSWATFHMFWDISLITAAAVSAYTALLGLPAIGIGLYKWRNTDVDSDGKPDA